jgi:hypothetical protein
MLGSQFSAIFCQFSAEKIGFDVQHISFVVIFVVGDMPVISEVQM